jgi:hypothetical protein
VKENNSEVPRISTIPENGAHVGLQKTQLKKWIKSLILTFLGVFIGAGLFLSGYRLGQSRQPQTISIPIIPLLPTPATSPLPSATSPPSIVSPTPIPSAPLKRINILPTEGWRMVYLNGVSFKIPPDARCKSSSLSEEENEQDCRLIYFTSTQIIPSQVSVSEYKGGSRREQYFGDHYEDCHWIYEEAYFGNVKALQIAADGGWCQGGAGAIITVIGDKFVVFRDLYYDPGTKIIHRFPPRDTIMSTLRKE